MATDWGASGRVDTYSLKAVDPFTLKVVETLPFDASSSSITEAYYSDNYSSASIMLEGSDYVKDGSERLLSIYHDVTAADGTKVSEVLGTFFVDSMTRNAKLHRQSRNLACYSTMIRSSDDKLTADFARAKGSNVVAAIRAVAEADGGKLRVMDGVDKTRTFSQPISFEIGTVKKTVMSEMAGWIGCVIGVDTYGYITLAPYQNPRSVAPKYVFTEGRQCMYLPGVDWDSNRDEVLNRVVMYYSRESKNDDDPYPLTDRVMVDLPESSRWSYDKVGRRKSEVVSVSQPCSHADLLAKAQIYLAENSAEILYITISHVQVPGLHAGDVVEYINNTDEEELHVTGLITQMEINNLGPGCMCTSKIKILTWIES